MQFDYLGPYKVDQVLGVGGMGTVYRGRHAKSGEVVAIKVIATALADQERFRRRFAAEVETLKRLKHPNIVQLIGYGEEQAHLFYSMDYVVGESLADQLKKVKKIDWEKTIQIAIDVVSALKHAHNFGIIHRDLKPANVMLTDKNEVKLTDFGIAKLYGSSEVTAVGSVLGTADYMPPEQAEGGLVTVRSDLYSLGAMMYALISGRSPHAARTMPEVLYNVRYSIPNPIHQVVPGTPIELSELIMQLLQKDPANRPPTALVVSNRLQSLKHGLITRTIVTDVVNEIEPLKPVDLASEFTSIDIEASTRPTSAIEANPSASKTGRPSSDGKKTFADRGTSPSSLSSEFSTGGISNRADPSVNDVTQIASKTNNPSLFIDGPTAPSQTKFTIVEEADRDIGSRHSSTDESESLWKHWISIGAIIALLIGSIASIFIFTRDPSADVLYRNLTESLDANQDGNVEDLEPLLDQFSALYPSDNRLKEFDPIRNDIEEQRTIRRLERRMRLGLSGNQLDPLEQAFLDGMKAQETDPELARIKLQSLLIVYSERKDLETKQRYLLEVAEHVLSKLKSGDIVKKNPATAQLEDQLAWAETSLEESLRPAFYRAIIELYEDKPWASGPVATAKQKLK